MAKDKRREVDSSKEHFALQVMGVLGGSGAVAALPLFAAIVADQAPALLGLIVFAFPLALAAIGKLRDIRWWQVTAAVVAALLVLAFVVPQIAPIVVIILALGAVISLIVVGKYLLDEDRIAAGSWLAATSIATIAGFLGIAAEVPGVAMVVGGVVLVGAVIALQRLRGLATRPT